ncbi:MAG TPA: hypothetical protein VFC93_17030 [Chloroflexota bacterium]|nr:hypothetical protein [Chloroflexota bacterium]
MAAGTKASGAPRRGPAARQGWAPRRTLSTYVDELTGAGFVLGTMRASAPLPVGPEAPLAHATPRLAPDRDALVVQRKLQRHPSRPA